MPRKGTSKRERPTDMIRVGDSEETRRAVKRALQIRQEQLPVFYLGIPALSQQMAERTPLDGEKQPTEVLGESRASSPMGSPMRGASTEREFSPSDFLIEHARTTLSQLQSTELDSSFKCDEEIEEPFFDYETKSEVIMTFGEQPGSVIRATKPILDYD